MYNGFFSIIIELSVVSCKAKMQYLLTYIKSKQVRLLFFLQNSVQELFTRLFTSNISMISNMQIKIRMID